MEIRKVPASAGAEWLLGAFGLLKKSPFGFGMLAVIYAVLSMGMAVFAGSIPSLAGPLQLVSMLLGALIVALMIYAAQEVDEGRSATLIALLGSLRGSNGGRMLKALVPQVIFALMLIAMVYLIIGTDNINKAMALIADIQAKAQAGTQIDPQTLAQGPIARVAIGSIVIMVISVIAVIFTMTLLPDMLLAGHSLGRALRRSVAAGARNLTAMLVYLILGFVLLMTISIGVGLVLGVLQLIFGEAATIAGNVLLYGVFINMFAGTMYFAWKQMLGGPMATPVVETSGVAM
jgi:hypothetical protein